MLIVRSILLARLLEPEIFGIYAGVNVIKGLTSVVAGFGLDGALVHRSHETEDEDAAAAVHFTLKMSFYGLWFGIMCAVALLAFEGVRQITLLVVALTTFVSMSTGTARVILRRRVVHRRLSLVQVVSDLSASILAIAVAVISPTIWALLITDAVLAIVPIVMLYLWRPVWRPKLSFDRVRIRYFLNFGKRLVGAQFLLRALDRVDDLWISVMLGDFWMGQYARAYTFATYPRSIVAMPVDAVALGSYAQLKHDRTGLSSMFFRINALLVRSGFLFAGILALIAPEFIRLVIGAKWLPFLDAFRLMLIFTMFDPVKVTVGDLFVAIGKPERVVRARVVQLIVLVVGLFTLGTAFGIAGVAVAVNLMLVIGIGLLLFDARKVIDFSVARLFGVPILALGAGLICGRLSLLLPNVAGSDIRTGSAKSIVYVVVYGVILLIFEGKQTVELVRSLLRR